MKTRHFLASAALAVMAAAPAFARGGKDDSPADAAAKFAAADADADGFLTLGEFATTLAGKKPLIEIRARFLKADTDDDDRVSAAEWATYKNDNLPDDSNGRPRKFDLADLDGSGDLTPDEFAGAFPQGTKPAKVMKKFGKFDRNDDGLLTRDEWNPGKKGKP